MAEKPSPYDTVVIPGGVIRPGYATPAEPRGGLGYVRDQLVGLGQGAIDVLQTPATLFRDATTDEGGQAAAQQAQRLAIKAKDWLGTLKTGYQQEQDALPREQRDPRGLVQEAFETVVQSAPALAAAGATGAAMPLTFGAMGVGQQGIEAEEQIYRMSEADLLKTPNYAKYRTEGMDHQQAQRRVYNDMRTPGAILPNFVANTVFGGTAGRLYGKAFSRTIAGSMGERVRRTVLQDVPEATIGGGVTGLAQGYGRQTGQIAGGLRDEYDVEEIKAEGWDMARNLGTVSGAVAVGRGLRPPARPPNAADRLIRDAGKKETLAPPIGADLLPVVTEQLDPPKPAEQVTPPAAAGQRAKINPEGSTARVTPAGNETVVTPPNKVSSFGEQLMAEVNAERAQQGLSPLPKEDFGLSDLAGATSTFDFKGAMQLGPGGATADLFNKAFDAYRKGSTKVVGIEEPYLVQAKAEGRVFASPREVREYSEAYQNSRPNTPAMWNDNGTMRPVEVVANSFGQRTPGGPFTYDILVDGETKRVPQNTLFNRPAETSAAPAAEAAAPKFTVEQLRERLMDLEQTPTHGDFLKTVQEWKDANKGQRLSNQGELAAEHGKLRADAAAAEKAQRELSKKQAKGYATLAKEQAEALKTKKSAEEVTPPGKPVVEPKAEAPAAAEAVPLAALVEEKPGPLGTARIRGTLGLRGAGAGVIHGKAAEPAIAEIQTERELKAAQAWDPVAKRQTKEAKTAARSAATGAKREEQVTQRESAAKQTMEDHKPGANYAAELDSIASTIKDKAPDAPEVRAHVDQIVSDVKEMVADYQDRLLNLRGGRDGHPVFMLGAGKGKSRAGKGEHHSFFSEMNNYLIEVNKALKKGDHTRAKELTERHLEHSKLVRGGEISKVTESRKAVSDAISVDKKTYGKGEAIEELSAKDVENLNPAEREIYEQQIRDQKRAEEARDTEEAAGKPTEGGIEDAEVRLAENPVQKITPAQAAAKGWSIPRRVGGRLRFSPKYPDASVGREHEYVNGKEASLDHEKAEELVFELQRAHDDMGLTGKQKLSEQEVSDILRLNGEKIERGTMAEVMKSFRPDEPILRSIFDAVHDVVKDMPVEIWSREAMEAYGDYMKPGTMGNGPLGVSSTRGGFVILRPDTRVAPVVFHEALHAATVRAILGSDRLTALVDNLQGIIEQRHKGDINITAEVPFQAAIRGVDGERVDTREFIAEIFSRPELVQLLKETNLTRSEARALRDLGYRADTGKSILRTLWDNFLKAIGFKASNPNAFKVAVDMLQDMFEREMYIRQSDEMSGRVAGQINTYPEMVNLAAADPVGGPGLIKAWQAGDHPEVTRSLMDMNERGVLDEKQADTAINYLNGLNRRYWGDDALGPSYKVTSTGNQEQIKQGIVKFLDDRLGDTVKDAGWQIDNKFRTPLRKLFSGITYTNDLGNTLEQGFQRVLKPIKDAWSRREHHAQEYMDTSGANKLIDDISKYKHSKVDRNLWAAFENLLIRESYGKAYADQPLGQGLNAHIKPGELRHRQAEKDYEKNVKLLEYIRGRDPKLIELRNRIFEFSRKELEARLNHQAADMLLRENMVAHGDDAGLSAMVKNVRRQDASMTPEERAAFTRLMKDITGEAYTQKRNDVRELLDGLNKEGPHVPFMRHGKHAVFAEYDVKPDEGVKYIEVPGKGHTRILDFADRKDFDHFVDNILGHEDVEISLNNAHEVIYDTQTGARAGSWIVEKPDGRADTYASEADAKAAMEKGDNLTSRFMETKDLEQMVENNQPTGHLKTYHRAIFNPTEFVRFDSEREAAEFREKLNRDDIHPNVTSKVTHVESPKDQISRANVAYTSAEMQAWINRIEASPAYQQLSPEQQADWKREHRIEAARVTMTAGRRTMHLPREYARGASTDILKNMIDFAGGNARAIAELKYRDAIDKGLQGADAYVDKFRHSAGRVPSAADPRLSGGLPAGTPEARGLLSREDQLREGGHRARDEVMRELKQRLFAPIRVEDSWATGIKRALQVSMIGHLADTGYLIINAIEPWILSGAISASRHGWAGTYAEMAETTRMLNASKLAKSAWQDIVASAKSEYRPGDYEKLLLDAVTGGRNKRGDGAGLAQMLQHMFQRGLVARDVGMEIERIHDPSKNIAFRGMDYLDGLFRGANTGIETFNRALMAVSNYRLEMKRALKDGLTGDAAHMQAVRYAEDAIFKGAGDYSAWNNPRYFNNPFMKLGAQFKKYPLRIASVYADAITGAVRGDREKQKQVAYMLMMQAMAAGSMGLPIGSFGAGAVNAAYILGADDNWDDKMLSMRKWLVDKIGVEGTDLFMHGALRFTGADFSQKMSQNSILFMGSPESRNPKALVTSLAMLGLGAPGDTGAKLIGGFQKLGEAAGHYAAGADSAGTQAGMEAAAGIIQIKQLHNIAKAFGMMTGNIKGLPKGEEGSTGQAMIQALGFTPTGIANRMEAKRAVTREVKKESQARSGQINRWVEAPDTERASIWRSIQRDYNAGQTDSKLRIQYQDLWKAQQRKKNEERRDDSKLGLKLSGRRAAFADTANYFDIE